MKEILHYIGDFFIHTDYFIVFSISWGLYMFTDTVKHPIKDNSPLIGGTLGGNYRGFIAGVGLVLLGVITLYGKLSDKKHLWAVMKRTSPELIKYTALTVFVLALGRLVYLFFFENFKEKERFRFWIVVLCCALLMLFSGWELIKIFDIF